MFDTTIKCVSMTALQLWKWPHFIKQCKCNLKTKNNATMLRVFLEEWKQELLLLLIIIILNSWYFSICEGIC